MYFSSAFQARGSQAPTTHTLNAAKVEDCPTKQLGNEVTVGVGPRVARGPEDASNSTLVQPGNKATWDAHVEGNGVGAMGSDSQNEGNPPRRNHVISRACPTPFYTAITGVLQKSPKLLNIEDRACSWPLLDH